MGDENLYQIGDITIPKMKVFDTKDLDDESSNESYNPSVNIFESNNDVNNIDSSRVLTMTTSDGIDITDKHRGTMALRIMCNGSSTGNGFSMTIHMFLYILSPNPTIFRDPKEKITYEDKNST